MRHAVTGSRPGSTEDSRVSAWACYAAGVVTGSDSRQDTPPSAAMTSAGPRRDEEALLLRLARALHERGASAPRVEGTVESLATRLGVRAQVFSTPTALQMAFGPDHDQRAHLLRARPGEVELGKLDDLDRLIAELSSGPIEIVSARQRLEAIEATPSAHGRMSVVLAFAATAAAAACLLGGGPLDAVVGFLLASITGAMALLVPRVEGGAALFEPGAAFLVSALATVAASVVPIREGIVTMSALIVLIPGLTFTVAMSELAARHLASGTARLAGAMTTFLTMAFGVAVGRVLALRIVGEPSLEPSPLLFPTFMPWIAVLVAAAAFVVLFAARWRQWPIIALVGAFGFATTSESAAIVGPELAAFLGALAVGLASNGYARVFRRSASVPLVPGLLLLVPGTIGFRSTTAFLASDVASGTDAAFDMAMTGTALVAGLLVAHLVLKSRRFL